MELGLKGGIRKIFKRNFLGTLLILAIVTLIRVDGIRFCVIQSPHIVRKANVQTQAHEIQNKID